MAKIERSMSIQATPEAIWEYLAEPSHWPEWDPDMAAVEADAPGFANGQAWTVHLAQPKITATVEFADVEASRQLGWNIRAMAGLMKSEATFRLEPLGDGSTTFHYEFEMGGLLGSMVQRLRREVVERGVDHGLANIAAATEMSSSG